MNSVASRITLASAMAISVLSACGGGGGGGTGSASTSTGVFLDAATEGITYTCGSVSGTTDSSGQFNYEANSTCTFKIGGVTLGSAPAKAVLTPVSLVSGATDETNATVSNIGRFLQSLDADNNPSNGITIGNTVRTALNSSSLDFTSGSFATDASTLVGAAITGRTLVNAATAEAHMRDTLLAKMAGTYSCSFSGTDNGSGTVTLTSGNPNGTISGTGNSNIYGGPASVAGTYSSAGTTSFTFGNVSTGATFSGSISVNGSGSGTWTNTHTTPTQSGSWSCTKS